jgi:hypothetical protein
MGKLAEAKNPEKKRYRDEEVPWQLSEFDYERLHRLPSEKLESLCIERDLPKSGTKGQRVRRLLEWKDNGFSAPKKAAVEKPEPMTCDAVMKNGSICRVKVKDGHFWCGKHRYT